MGRVRAFLGNSEQQAEEEEEEEEEEGHHVQGHEADQYR